MSRGLRRREVEIKEKKRHMYHLLVTPVICNSAYSARAQEEVSETVGFHGNWGTVKSPESPGNWGPSKKQVDVRKTPELQLAAKPLWRGTTFKSISIQHQNTQDSILFFL